MKKLLGAVLMAGSLISFAIFFFGSVDGEKARMARIADYGSAGALTANPRSIYLIAGLAMGLAGGALWKS